MKSALTIVFAALVAATTAFFAAPAFAQEGTCLSDRDAYTAVQRGEIPSLNQVLRANGIDRSTQVLSDEVCQDAGGLTYYVNVINAYGEAETLVLPASE